MQLRFSVFSDPMYAPDRTVDFDSGDVISVQQRTVSLLMRGRYPVTVVKLKSGAEYILEGYVEGEIRSAMAGAEK